MKHPYRSIVVLVPPTRVRAWARTIAHVLRVSFSTPVTLARLGNDEAGPEPFPSESLERCLFGMPKPGHTAWTATGELPDAEAIACDDALVVNLTERRADDLPLRFSRLPILSPRFHGHPASDGLLWPLANRRLPHLGVTLHRPGESERLLCGACLALPEPVVLLRALNTVFARTITVVRDAAAHALEGKPLCPAAPPPEPVPGSLGMRFWARRLMGAYWPRALGHIRKRFVYEEDWSVGVCRRNDTSAPPWCDLGAERFALMPSPPGHFFADPMLFRHAGRSVLFFEDYDCATRRGRISCAEIGPEGRVGEPVEVLARPYHLSYPYVFRDSSAIFMLPETSGNGRIELYEAESFPERWRLRAVLLDDIEAADPTVFFDDSRGTWWMFATVTGFSESPYDTLSIFYSDALEGPWRPHAMNPVKRDPSSSRPAGPLLQQGNRLFRPAQDCTQGYGSGLALCEIEELTPDSFREKVVARHRPPTPFTGMHTYSQDDAFVAVDFKRRRRRSR